MVYIYTEWGTIGLSEVTQDRICLRGYLTQHCRCVFNAYFEHYEMVTSHIMHHSCPVADELLLLIILGFVKLYSTCGLFVVFLMASEVLPTPVRTSGMGITVVFGMLGMVVAPHVLHVRTLLLASSLCSFRTTVVGCCVVIKNVVPLRCLAVWAWRGWPLLDPAGDDIGLCVFHDPLPGDVRATIASDFPGCRGAGTRPPLYHVDPPLEPSQILTTIRTSTRTTQ